MPLIGIKNEIKTGALKIIEREGLPITTTWKLIWHKDKNLSPVSKAFLAYLAENKEPVMQKHFQ